MSFELSLYDVIGVAISLISLAISLLTYLESKPKIKVVSASGKYVRTKKYDIVTGKKAQYKGFVAVTLINQSASPISIHKISLEDINYAFSENYTCRITPSDKHQNANIQVSISPEGPALHLPLYIEAYSSVKTTLVFDDIERYIGEQGRKIIYPNKGTLKLVFYTSRKKVIIKTPFSKAV